MHTVLLEETSCRAAKWLLLPGAGQSVFKLQLLRSPSAQEAHWACLVLCTPVSRCCPLGTMLVLGTYAPMCSLPSSLCCNLQGAELAAGLDQPEGVVPTPSMVSTMLNDVRQLTQLLWGDAGRASRVLQLVARHAGTGSAAARMAGYPEPAGPSTSQRQLLGLLDSVLMMLLASSVPVPAGDEQGDTGALSVVLLTAVLKRLHSHHRTDALLVAEHFPSHLSTDPQARHMLAELDMKATRSVLPADMEKHRLLLDKVDTHWIPRAL